MVAIKSKLMNGLLHLQEIENDRINAESLSREAFERMTLNKSHESSTSNDNSNDDDNDDDDHGAELISAAATDECDESTAKPARKLRATKSLPVSVHQITYRPQRLSEVR